MTSFSIVSILKYCGTKKKGEKGRTEEINVVRSIRPTSTTPKAKWLHISFT